MPARRTWLTSAEVATRLHVSPKTVSRWAKHGLLEHRRTLGGHRRYDPDRIDQLAHALTRDHRPGAPTRRHHTRTRPRRPTPPPHPDPKEPR